MRPSAAIVLAVGLFACTGEIRDPRALACADVVKHYLNLQGAVIVTEAAENMSRDGLEIAYEGTNAENIPVEGTADCAFDEGTTTITAARVGNHLVPLDN